MSIINSNWCDICGREVCVCYAFFGEKKDEEKAVAPEVNTTVKCKGTTKKGDPCKNNAKKGFEFCGPHQDQMDKKASEANIVEDEKIIPNEEEVIEIPDLFERPVTGAIVQPSLITRAEATSEPDLFIIAGTGARGIALANKEAKKGLAEWLDARLTRAKAKYGDKLVIMSGGAEGFDHALALAAIKLDIKLWVALPSGDYGSYYWGRASITNRVRIDAFTHFITKAWRVTEVMPSPKGSDKYKNRFGAANFDRNDFMVEQANAFLIYEPNSTGTKHCFEAIVKTGKPYQVIRRFE